MFGFNSLFLQNVLGYSATQTGAVFLPMTVLIIVVAPGPAATGQGGVEVASSAPA